MGAFNKTIIPLAPRWLSIISYPTRPRGVIVKYTMMAKPIRTLELHYPMVRFLIIIISHYRCHYHLPIIIIIIIIVVVVVIKASNIPITILYL